MRKRVIKSGLVIVVMMADKCGKFQSNWSMDFQNIWDGTQTHTWIQWILMLSKLKKGHNLVQMLERVIMGNHILVSSCDNDGE